MKETVKVKGKKYKECSENEYHERKNTLSIEVNGEVTYYKEVKEEFLATINGNPVSAKDNNLIINGYHYDIDYIEELLKEYKEYLKR